MPGEDELIQAQQHLAEGLKLLMQVFPNGLTTRIINVEPGATLWSLAETFLDNGQRWRELYLTNLDTIFHNQAVNRANFEGSPNLIYAGTTLRVLAF